MSFTQIRIKSEVKDRLKLLADADNRSMANYLEVLIDTAIDAKRLTEPQIKAISQFTNKTAPRTKP